MVKGGERRERYNCMSLAKKSSPEYTSKNKLIKKKKDKPHTTSGQKYQTDLV